MLRTSYLSQALDPADFNNTIKSVVDVIKSLFPDFKGGIAFRGSSGCLVAMPVCVALGAVPIMVRKEDGNHSHLKVEGYYVPEFIIVDDLVATGNTVRNIMDAIATAYVEQNMRECRCLGVITYTEYKRSDNSAKYVVEPRAEHNWTSIPVYGTRDF